MTDYPYVGGAPLEQRRNYAYSPYEGSAFLDAWRASRQSALATLGAPETRPTTVALPALPPETGPVETEALLEHLIARRGATSDSRAWRKWMIQRFEVSKRVHTGYTIEGARSRGNGDYGQFDLYLRLAEMLAASAEHEAHLPSLNALLKCVDTLCSYREQLDLSRGRRLASLIEAEARAVAGAAGWHADAPAHFDPPAAVPVGGRLEGVTLLAADTMRSRGYAQALLRSGFRLPRALVVKSPGQERRWGQSDDPPPPDPVLDGYFTPDLRIPLEETCRKLADDLDVLPTGTVNAPEVTEWLSDARARLAIYSGFGGELVGQGLLESGPPLLHMHAGWLPDYRGSTTVYYSWLREGTCGVSAILLSPEIDEGAVVGRKRYPPPQPGSDADYLHDSVIRSDLLIQLMGVFFETGDLPEAVPQDGSEGDTFYIVHPVLKHLAVLKGVSANHGETACQTS